MTKKNNKPAKPDNAAADLEAAGFAVDQIRQALGCAPDEDVLDKARATVEHLALVKTALAKLEGDGLLGEHVRAALRGEGLQDKDPVELARHRMDELDAAITAHRRGEAEKAEAFRALCVLADKYGLKVDADINTMPALIELLARALAGLDKRIDEACEILDIPERKRGVEAMLTAIRELDAGLTRRIKELHREIEDTRKILGIDDPDGMLLDEQGHVMGDIMDAWAETKRVLLVNQYPIPDSLPEACLALTALVEELDGRIDSALGNLARHTSATAIEDATMEVRDKLDDAETRLKHLENERLRQALEDPEFPPRGPIAMGTLNITSIDGGDENARIVRDLMRKIVDGKISLLHNV